MIFKAVVIDNREFFNKGTITVRIAGHFFRHIEWDLSNDFPDFIDEARDNNAQEFTNDYEAMLTGGIGGGRNYGSVFIPQINEKGIVAFLGGGKTKPIWLGGIFEPVRDDSFNIELVNLPSDKLDSEDDAVIDGQSNLEADPLEINYILRTKNTNRDNAAGLNWEEVPTTNIISIGKRGMRASHLQEDKEKTIDILDDRISIVMRNGDTERIIEIDDETGKIKIITEGDIEVEGDNIAFKAENKITLKSEDHSAVRYDKLIEIIERFEDHSHISYGGGPTGPPVESAGAPLISTVLISDKRDLESPNIKLE